MQPTACPELVEGAQAVGPRRDTDKPQRGEESSVPLTRQHHCYHRGRRFSIICANRTYDDELAGHHARDFPLAFIFNSLRPRRRRNISRRRTLSSRALLRRAWIQPPTNASVANNRRPARNRETGRRAPATPEWPSSRRLPNPNLFPCPLPWARCAPRFCCPPPGANGTTPSSTQWSPTKSRTSPAVTRSPSAFRFCIAQFSGSARSPGGSTVISPTSPSKPATKPLYPAAPTASVTPPLCWNFLRPCRPHRVACGGKAFRWPKQVRQKKESNEFSPGKEPSPWVSKNRASRNQRSKNRLRSQPSRSQFR